MATSNSTANSAKPSAQDIHQGEILFYEIADMAARLQYLATQIVAADSDPDLGSVAELASSARYIAGQIGFAADLGTGKIDGTGRTNVRGGAENWLMSPSYFTEMGVQS